MKQIKYPSKVLLFGEYTVLSGGTALAVPHKDYFGLWQQTSNPVILDPTFVKHLSRQCRDLYRALDIDLLDRRMHAGWHFTSNIPYGKGLGSSAALTAGIYDNFGIGDPPDLDKIKKDLAQIESFFHGQSSGLDALVSYTQRAIELGSDGLAKEIESLQIRDEIYLFDSQLSRETQPLVNWYRNQLQSIAFEKEMKHLGALSTRAIERIRVGKSVLNTVNEISSFQYSYLKFLIPSAIQKLWKETLADSEIAMKLCGAGGGGYFLLFGSTGAIDANTFGQLSRLNSHARGGGGESGNFM